MALGHDRVRGEVSRRSRRVPASAKERSGPCFDLPRQTSDALDDANGPRSGPATACSVGKIAESKLPDVETRTPIADRSRVSARVCKIGQTDRSSWRVPRMHQGGPDGVGDSGNPAREGVEYGAPAGQVASLIALATQPPPRIIGYP